MLNQTIQAPKPNGERPIFAAKNIEKPQKNKKPESDSPKLDPDQIFEAAKKRGFLYGELYSEVCVHSQMQFQARIYHTRYNVTKGVVLKLFNGSNSLTITSSTPTTESLINAFKGEQATSQPSSIVFSDSINQIKTSSDEIQKISFLAQLAKEFSSKFCDPQLPRILYNDTRRCYLVADSEGLTATGVDEGASWIAEWMSQTDRLKKDRKAYHRHSIDSLLHDLKLCNLSDSHGQLNHPKELWPAPYGEIPILWSEYCFAKLNYLLLQAFEGDRFLSGQSFLAASPHLPNSYDIEEIASSEEGEYDHEGSKRSGQLILNSGKPRSLACNRLVADEMGVVPTGHARRASYRDPTVISFWSPRIISKNQKTSLLSSMTYGIAVHDLEILNYKPSADRVIILIKAGYLIHHGEKGERIEPFAIECSLTSLLGRCDSFTRHTEVIGFEIKKSGQPLIVEIESPAARSIPIQISGKVPKSHYWDL